MSTPPPAAGPTPPAAPGIPVRPLAAWTLLALVATLILAGAASWVFPPFRMDFVNRIGYPDFTSLTILVGPLLAVLLATRVGPALAYARTIAQVALLEYAAALLFGLLAFLFTLADRFDVGGRGAFYAFGGVIQGFGGIIAELLRLALLALAALWVYQTFRNLGGRLPQINVRTT